jgi:hypothetical protein
MRPCDLRLIRMTLLLAAVPIAACRDASPSKVANQAQVAVAAPSVVEQAAPTPPTPPTLPQDPAFPDTLPVATSDTKLADAGDSDIAQDAIGVADCDAYIRAMNECYLPKLAPEVRDPILAPMKQERLAWKTSTDQVAIAAECRRVLDERRAVLTQSGCL